MATDDTQNQQQNEQNQKSKKPRIEEPPPLQQQSKHDENIEYTKLPEELNGIDFSERISWRKYAPYVENKTLPLTAETTDHDGVCTPPLEQGTALRLDVHGISGRARACTLNLPHGPIRTPGK